MDERYPVPLIKSDGFLLELDDQGVESREIALRFSDGSIADAPFDMAFDSLGDLYVVGRNLPDEGPLGAYWAEGSGFLLKLVPSP